MRRRNLIVILTLVCGLIIVQNSTFAQGLELEYADIYITPETNPNFFSGLVGGDGDFITDQWLDWSIGNGIPFNTFGDNDMVFSTCIGNFGNPANWFERIRITEAGNVGIGTTSPTEKLDVIGTIQTEVLKITGGSDLSEQFDINKPINIDGIIAHEALKIKPGMVVCIDPENPGKLLINKEAYDTKVAGIISGAGGVQPGMLMGQKGSVADGKYPVALTGRVYCYTDATKNSIQPGDLLTTSDTPGHAMKVTEYAKAHGAILGKAMSPLENGKGLVLVLVTLQ